MMNAIWAFMVVVALLCGAVNGKIDAVTTASVESAETAVKLAIGLVGVMAFWLGMMRILQDGGFLNRLARMLGPVMRKLFPDIPAQHPAMSFMILNISANLLGLANAATPFGLKAMNELDRMNPKKGTATNAMALFLAINTSGVTLIPTSMIALRASLNSSAPGAIFLPTLLASLFGTFVAIATCFLLQKIPAFSWDRYPVLDAAEAAEARAALEGKDAEAEIMRATASNSHPTALGRAMAALCTVGLGIAFIYALKLRSATVVNDAPIGWGGALKAAVMEWPLVLLIGSITLYGIARGVKIYDSLVEGGKEAFQVAVRIIPFLVVILVAVGMLRASGAVDLLTGALAPLTAWIGMPAEVLPMAFLRSLTGSGAYGIAAELMKTHGPDTLIGQIVSTLQGSSETTFYVIAVYFGAVQVRNGRHTLAACLIADAAAVLASVWFVRMLLA